MIRIAYILSLTISLIGCGQTDKSNGSKRYVSDTLVPSHKERRIYSDSLLSFDDASFSNIQVRGAISENEFQKHKATSSSQCTFDTAQSKVRSALYIISNCNDICDTYVGEAGTNRRLLLPSNFDQGVINILPSPDCKRLIIFSSYDMPGYGDFYDHRSELYSFTIKIEQGIDGIQPASKYFSKKWSMADVTWVDNKTVAVKVYSNEKPVDKDYKYYLVEL